MIERKVKLYIATDGKEFSNEDECRDHEIQITKEIIDAINYSDDLIIHSDRCVSNITLPEEISRIYRRLGVAFVYYIRNKNGLNLLNRFFQICEICQGYSKDIIQEDESSIMNGIRVIMEDDRCNTYKTDKSIEDIIAGLITMKEHFYDKMEETGHEEQ